VPNDAAATAATTHFGGVNAMVPMRADSIVAKAGPDRRVRAVGKLRAASGAGEGGTPMTSPDRKRSPVGPVFATCSVATPGGGGVAVVKVSVRGEAGVAVAVSVAGLGVRLAKVPFSAGPSPIKLPRSISERLTV
jgi:hypothetical protein